MATLFANPRYTPVDAQGDPYPGATLTFYAAGTTTPHPVYTTSAATVPHPNPVTANSAGQFPPIYYDDALQYRALLRDATGVLLWDIDLINSNLTAEEIGRALYTRTTAENSANVTPTAYRFPPGDVRRYGAVGNGVADDSAAINSALAVGGKVYLDGGLTYRGTLLSMSVPRTELEICGGSTLSQITATNTLISVSGSDCSIHGAGRLLSPAIFDGTNAERTYAVVYVTANGFQFRDATLENVPRAGIVFKNATGGRVSNARIRGNFPYASYTGSNTGHAAIDYDPPTSTHADRPSLVVSGCIIETSVQGVLTGNFGDAAHEAGVTITGNTFSQCWDHGVYLTFSEGNVITGNSFANCKAPIVVDGVGSVVSGNSCYSTEPTQSNGQQIISVRDAQGATITGNTIYGLSAAILCDAVSGEIVRDNLIANNTIISTGAGIATSAIRLGNGAQTVDNNTVKGNTIIGNAAGSFGEFVGAIQLETESASYTGKNNVVRDNHVRITGKSYAINLLRHDDTICEGNVIEFTHSAGGAATYIMTNVDDSDNCLLARNTFIWRTGGTNITARGINIASGTGNRVEANRFRLTSGSLAGTSPVVDAGSSTDLIASSGEPAANTNTPSGATAHAMPVYDASGTLLGYVPVYASVW